MADEFLPERWRVWGEAARSAGHGDGTEPELGIVAAMDMTLPGLVSQESIEQGGAWLEMPDSRAW